MAIKLQPPPEPGRPYDIPEEGSLVLLALGAEGVKAWRHKRDGRPGDYVFSAPIQYRPRRRIKHHTGERLAKKVLLIGWDAADWKVINPIMDAGHMPTLERLVNTGSIGNIATLDPPLSPMLWTSVATGHTADKHGILGFVQPDAEAQKLRPVLGTSRRRKAVWNILHQAGLRCHVVGWWPSHPAEPLNGVSVSDFYAHITHRRGEPEPLPPGAVHPPEVAETLAGLRVYPQELTAAHILPFVPQAARIDQEQDRRLIGLTNTLARCASIQAAATWAMANEPWEFMAVYFDGIDHFSHQFMRFHPPRQEFVAEDLYAIYHPVITAAYRFHDMMLHYLLEMAGEDTTVILLSDHGFHPDHLRLKAIPREPAGPAVEHRHYGIVCLRGPAVHQDERFYGATLLDIAPTILHLFGLPVGQDMDGKPLIQALTRSDLPAFIPTWEDVAGESGQHPPEARQDPWAEQAMLQQLSELGYIETGAGNKQIQRVAREMDYYLARVYLSRGRRQEALPLLEKLYASNPAVRRYAILLGRLYLMLHRPADCRRIVTEMTAREEEPYAALDLLQAYLLLAEGKPEEALARLRQIEEVLPHRPELHRRIGQAYCRLEAWPEALKSFQNALAIDPEHARTYCDMAYVCLYLNQYEDAVDAALTAVGLIYHQPVAHFYLAEGLRRLGEWERATEAYQVCLAQAPGIVQAHQQLADLYEHYWLQPASAAEHRSLAATLLAQAKGE